jgi:hypothetical protein
MALHVGQRECRNRRDLRRTLQCVERQFHRHRQISPSTEYCLRVRNWFPQRFRYRSQRPAGPRHPPPEVAGSRQSRTAWTSRRLWPIWVGAPELTFGQNFRPERPCPSQRASPRITTPPASTIQRARVHAEPALRASVNDSGLSQNARLQARSRTPACAGRGQG